MRRLSVLLLLFALAVPASAQQRVVGLDRLPIVVKDLARARADLDSLGFNVKADRPHDPDVATAYVKFKDGSALELISPVSDDEDTAQYRDWLKDGEGPISFGLYRPGSTNTPPPGVFFGARQRSATDMFEDFQHDNSALSLMGVWLAGSPSERKIANLPGAKMVNGTFCMPLGYGTKAVQFGEAEIPLLPESAQQVRGRPIIAATIAVQKLDIAHGYFDGRGKRYRQVAGCGRQSLWVEIRGLWLEFRER